MTPSAKYELIFVLLLGLFLFGIISYSVIYSRAGVRDDLRKQDITHLKIALEKYFNAHDSYVREPKYSIGCTTTSETSWFFGNTSPLLREQFIDAIPHDVRENSNHLYTYCITSVEKKHATGYYLEATLENQATDGTYFDEDEHRKFDYRILHKNGKTLYRVCGGTETQCKLTEPEQLSKGE